MRHLILFGVSLAGVSASAEVRVASTAFTTRGVSPELGAVYAERFAGALRTHGITVTTEKDLASVISVERQKELLGCADSSNSCLTELAGALGAPFVVTGNVSRIGTAVTLSIKVLQVDKSRSIFTLSSELPSVEKVLDALEGAASEAAERLRAVSADTGNAPALVRVQQSGPSPTPPWLLISVGAVGVGGGVALLIAAQSFAAILYGDPQPDFGPDQATALAQKTSTARLAGGIAVGVGAAFVVAGIVWRVAQSSGPQVAVVPLSGGAAFALTSTW